jgi:N-acyl-D-aspartate/D-glutamate deacylase
MEAGARGFSTGLDYHPSTVSDLEEIVELARVAAAYGGFFTSHIRGYSGNVINAVAEAIEVGRRAGVPVQISHLGVAGRKHWGYGARLRDIMNKARADGVPVACDMMAYPTAGAWWSARAIFPGWAYDWREPWETALPKLQALLRDPETRARLAAEIEARRERPKFGFHEEFAIFSNWGDIYVHELPGGSPHYAHLGADVASAAAAEGRDPCDLYFEMIEDGGESFAAVHSPMGPADFRGLFEDAHTMFGTDAIGTSIERLREPWNPLQPHPRHYGTFPRVLGKFVREEKWLELGEAVRRMSGLPAAHFGLSGRGEVREGFAADLVVLDPETVREEGTWRVPSAYPSGIEHVFVNGVEAVRDGRFTGRLAGTLLTRQAG